MKKTSKSTIVCIFGSLLLAVFVSVSAILISVKIGFASEHAIMNALDDVDYYLIVYDDFMGKCESLAIPNGLNATVFNDVFSMEQIHSDGSGYLKAELNSTPFEIDLKGYKQKLSKNIYAYVKKNNLTADGDAKEIVADFTNEIMDYYLDIIRVPHAASMGAVVRAISVYFPFLFAAMILLSVCTIWILIKQNPRKKSRLFRYLSYSIMSGAVSTLIVPFFCGITKFYKKLQIYPEYLYEFIVNYLENGSYVMLIIGLLLFAAGGVLICLSCCMEYQKTHRNIKKIRT
ncbi:MAG: hypothetical protein K2O02_03865 [Lachnospiraceae bacterium]|nr:hypothetical protein [Lachnospiraceae bacterium]